MSITKRFLPTLLICLLCVGCGEDNQEINTDTSNNFVNGSILNKELTTQQEIYEWSDWNMRWKKSRQARKQYIELRHTHPDEALKVYIEYYNWMYYGHPLAEKIATMSVKMDMAGETTISEMLEKLNLELEMIKDLVLTTKEEVEEVKSDIRFWSDMREEIIAHGGKETDCKIEFEISDITTE